MSKELISEFYKQIAQLRPLLQRGDTVAIVADLAANGTPYTKESVHRTLQGKGANITIAKAILKQMKKRKKEFETFNKEAADLLAE